MLDKLFRAQTSTLKAPSDDLLEALNAPQSAAGKVVTPDTALRVAAVYACVRILSETVAALVRLSRNPNGSPAISPCLKVYSGTSPVMWVFSATTPTAVLV